MLRIAICLVLMALNGYGVPSAIRNEAEKPLGFVAVLVSVHVTVILGLVYVVTGLIDHG